VGDDLQAVTDVPERETVIVGDVLGALNRLDRVYAWRNNTGTAWISGRPVKFSEKGAADVLACVDGCFVAIECKTRKGRQSAAQKCWQQKIEAAGGLYVLARSADDVLAALRSELGIALAPRPSRVRVIHR